ncbi:PEP-CTERM sorting domain-containing protein [Roseateles sp. BYS78W]|uniref:PEP-CTERM sorting domain-containing protein n=1 Tax=Pelomonas candidula TaxID=3299025 RepID=A0ABW7HKJ3_9BURK
MSKSLCLIAASLLTTLAAAAHADYVTTSQDVTFTFHVVDSNTFTLEILNGDTPSGNWSTAGYLSYLGFDGLGGKLPGLTGVNVSVTPSPSTTISWAYSHTELAGQGCNKTGNSGAFCLDANPNIQMTSDMVFTIDLLGTGIDLTGAIAPALKVGFTDKTGSKPIGDLLSTTMTYVPPTVLVTDVVDPPTAGPSGTTRDLPEPASLALAGLALAGVAAASRRRRSA